jgi:aerobic carbon-monoxide dehydrogenase medium subunit
VKPPAFDYSRPESVAEAVRLLADLGDDGKVLAGGQSLVPLLSMRLAAPHHLVDINRLHELDYVRVSDGTVRIGALARHATVLASEEAAAAQPLLRQALRLVAHPTIRNRGTTLGSIVHADPSGEMTAVLALLNGTVTIASAAGERSVAAADFFLGPLESAVTAGDLAIEAAVPVLAAHTGTAFLEVARRHGDYAVCGVATVVAPDSTRVAFLSMAPTPLVLDLTGVATGELGDAVRDQVEPESDIHASAGYRRHLAAVLTERAVAEARARAAACVSTPCGSW